MGHIVHVLGFACHALSVAATELGEHSAKAARKRGWDLTLFLRMGGGAHMARAVPYLSLV